MPRIDEEGIKKQIKERNFSNVYMFYGEENYLKQFYINKIKSIAVEPTFADFNCHEIDGNNASIDEIIRDALMLPMMSEYNLVLVHDYPLNKSKDDMKALKEYFKDIPKSTILIFWFDSIVVNTEDNKSTSWKTIESNFQKVGTTVYLKRKTDFELAKIVVARAKKRNCIISNDLAKYLVSIVGNDFRTVYNEIDKISSMVNGGEIKKSDIETLATKCFQAKVFDLSKLIVKGNNDAAFNVLNSLLYNKEEPSAIIAVIAMSYSDMYRVKCAKSSLVNEYDLSNYFFTYKSRSFAIKYASSDCRNLTIEQLRKSIDILAEADKNIKSTGVDKNLIVEQAVAMLLNEVHNA